MDGYMIICAGQGDTLISIVRKETWDWLSSDPPPFKKGLGDDSQNIPKIQKDLMVKKSSEEGYAPEFWVTIGSFENDRALLSVSDLPGIEGQTFLEYKEAAEAMKRHNINIVDEFHGEIY